MKCSFEEVPSPTLDFYLYLAEPACFWFDCTHTHRHRHTDTHTHTHLFWITIKSFLLSFDTPQESLLLTAASHPSHPHLSRSGIPPVSLILTLPLALSRLISTCEGLAVLKQVDGTFPFLNLHSKLSDLASTVTTFWKFSLCWLSCDQHLRSFVSQTFLAFQQSKSVWNFSPNSRVIKYRNCQFGAVLCSRNWF